jgi:TfoX N-terminal domain
MTNLQPLADILLADLRIVSMAYAERTAEWVRKVLSGRRDVVEKYLMGGLCFMVDGRMCCSVSSKGGLLIRVGPSAHEQVLREPHVRPMEMRGRTMIGFVRVAPDGYRTDTALKKWIQRGLDFVATLPAGSSQPKVSREAPMRRRKG